MTMRVEAQLDEGFGTSITGSPDGSLWVASTTNVAYLWRRKDQRDQLLHSVKVIGHVAGRAGFSDDGATVRVGRCTVDVESGSVDEIGEFDAPWLVAAPDHHGQDDEPGDTSLLISTLDSDTGESANASDFTTPVVVHVPGSTMAVVRTQFLQPRDRGAVSGYLGPMGRLLLADLDAGSLVKELAHDGSQFGCIDASGQVIAAAEVRKIRTWRSSTGSPLATWSADDIVDAVAISPTGDVATLNRDGWAFISTVDGNELRGWHVHDGAGAAVAWSPSGDRLAVGSRGGHVSVWDVSSGDSELIDTYDADSVGGLSFINSEDSLIVATDVVDQSMFRLSIKG